MLTIYSIKTLRLLAVLSCFQALLVLGAPASAEDSMTAQLTKILDANSKTRRDSTNYMSKHFDRLSDLKSKRLGSLHLRWDDATWSQFVKDLGGISTDEKRDKVNPHLAHLSLPNPDGSTFDLRIEKHTMCDATPFSIAVIPNPDTKHGWMPVEHKTFGEVARAIHGASEGDIAKGSKALIDACLKMAKPVFGRLSGDKDCEAIFPAPKKRDSSPSLLVNREDSVNKLLEAARYWILLYVQTGMLGYIGGYLAFMFNMGQTYAHGGRMFVGDPQQDNPSAMAARARAYSYLTAMLFYIIVENFQRAMKWDTIGEVISMKVVYPLVNVLFDALQKIWDTIKPKQDQGEKGKRNIPADCLNVNDFKFLLQHIGEVSKQNLDDLKAKKPQVCPNPKL